jgi:GT2 family glycosyltransferase
MEAKIGLVTVLYNSDGVLDGFLKSVSEQDYKNYILYIVDNSVNPLSTKLIFELFQKYNLEDNSVYLPSEDNYGVAKGNNIGIKEALKSNCDYIILTNNDVKFDNSNLFSSLVEISIKKNTQIVSPKILIWDTSKIWFAGCGFNKLLVKPIVYDYKMEEQPKHNISMICDNGPTCFVLFRSSIFEEVGMMDEKYFVYMDDIDFFYRCQLKGIQNYYESSLSIRHYENYSTGTNSDFAYYHIFRNRIYFVRKFYKNWNYIFSMSYILGAFFIKSIIEKRIKLYLKGIKSGFGL